MTKLRLNYTGEQINITIPERKVELLTNLQFIKLNTYTNDNNDVIKGDNFIIPLENMNTPGSRSCIMLNKVDDNEISNHFINTIGGEKWEEYKEIRNYMEFVEFRQYMSMSPGFMKSIKYC